MSLLDDDRVRESPALFGLAGGITENRRLANESWERALDAAIREGHPERLIAACAGISGPAVHQRKRRLASTEQQRSGVDR